MERSITVLIVVAVFLFTSCEETLIQEDYQNTPVRNFEVFTTDFRNMYGAFDAKKLDWDSLVQVYSQRVDNTISSEELYRILTEMLHELNDGHADLWAINHGYFRSWNRRDKPYFKGRQGMNMNDVVALQNVIRKKYLRIDYQSGSFSGWLFFYGTIVYEQKHIGYICIPTFNISDFPNDLIQKAVDEFNQLDAVVIDLRFNGGGRTEAFVGLHNRFGSEEKTYLKSSYKNGPGLTDFTPHAEHRVRPHTTSLKNKPIALLTNAYTASSSDHFVVAMKTQPDVICVGDTTCGAFSAVLERILPNGWKYRLGAQVVYGPDGRFLSDGDGNYLEGIGIAPDFYVADDWSKVMSDKDGVLDKALEELKKKIKN